MKISASLLLVAAALCGVSMAIDLNTVTDDGLSFGFYQAKCPQFESIVYEKVSQWTTKDSTLAPSLMRLHFHDCAVRVSNSLGLMSKPVLKFQTKYANRQLFSLTTWMWFYRDVMRRFCLTMPGARENLWWASRWEGFKSLMKSKRRWRRSVPWRCRVPTYWRQLPEMPQSLPVDHSGWFLTVGEMVLFPLAERPTSFPQATRTSPTSSSSSSPKVLMFSTWSYSQVIDRSYIT